MHLAPILPTRPPFSLGHSLKFDSRFESGNLRRVIQVGERDYNLILRNDINTNSHHQWFYFEVSNIADLASYRLVDINNNSHHQWFYFEVSNIADLAPYRLVDINTYSHH